MVSIGLTAMDGLWCRGMNQTKYHARDRHDRTLCHAPLLPTILARPRSELELSNPELLCKNCLGETAYRRLQKEKPDMNRERMTKDALEAATQEAYAALEKLEAAAQEREADLLARLSATPKLTSLADVQDRIADLIEFLTEGEPPRETAPLRLLLMQALMEARRVAADGEGEAS